MIKKLLITSAILLSTVTTSYAWELKTPGPTETEVRLDALETELYINRTSHEFRPYTAEEMKELTEQQERDMKRLNDFLTIPEGIMTQKGYEAMTEQSK